eukprot:TRINITY_DN95863_c0_g1_i1.p1 TRINITY_DN95863_c0_g1~~TRINITY_DN95863_c0_g1_i1.p1  ORF type:complete len:526 (+),score=75.72 TRINITY_DN95863_c0_g1_i1:13-1590(+)
MTDLLSINNLGSSLGISAGDVPLRLQPSAALRRSSSYSSTSRKDGSSVRAQTVAALVLAGPQQQTLVATVEMTITLCTDYDVKLDAHVDGARPEPSDFPEVCLAGSSHRITFVTAFLEKKTRANRQGAVKIDGFMPVAFHVARGKGTSYVGFPGRRRYSEVSHERWEWKDGQDKPSEGKAADFEIIGHSSLLRITVRAATEFEVHRACSLQALRDAEEQGDYDTLHAQLSKARTAGVELDHLNHAEDLLKRWRKQGFHVSVGCAKDSLRSLMQWDRVTNSTLLPCRKTCESSRDCPCNTHDGAGETLQIIPCVVQSVLGDENGDKLMFEGLVNAALDAEEGSVWRAGGKLIFSAFSRNQSINAMMRTLQGLGKDSCAQYLLKLVQFSEATYGGYVTAAQVNFHPNKDTFHDQHRDVYSAKQRAGPNCNCSFKEAVGTVCYSLGSNRRCSLETMTDEFSVIKSCGDNCQGCTETRWLPSGCAMYFNDVWNQNHTHGIPKMEEDCGPRISIAFLMGAPDAPKILEHT